MSPPCNCGLCRFCSREQSNHDERAIYLDWSSPFSGPDPLDRAMNEYRTLPSRARPRPCLHHSPSSASTSRRVASTRPMTSSALAELQGDDAETQLPPPDPNGQFPYAPTDSTDAQPARRRRRIRDIWRATRDFAQRIISPSAPPVPSATTAQNHSPLNSPAQPSRFRRVLGALRRRR